MIIVLPMPFLSPTLACSYLDFTGAGLAQANQVRRGGVRVLVGHHTHTHTYTRTHSLSALTQAHMQLLGCAKQFSENLYANAHSASPASQRTEEGMDAVRKQILEFFSRSCVSLFSRSCVSLLL
jgi:selenocysteine lyase/cysteine desulfurase